MERLFTRPGLEIFHISRDEHGQIICRADSTCFNSLIEKLDEFSVTKLILILGLEKEPFFPEFDRVKGRGKLRSLSIGGFSSPFKGLSPDFNYEIMADFHALTELDVDYIPFAKKALEYLPQIQHLFITWKENPIEQLGTKCPDLRWLWLDGFRGPLTRIGPAPNLTELRLYVASIDSIEGIADMYPALETLIIHGQRKELDVSPLAQCKKLKYLKFDAFTKSRGIDELRIPSLEMAYLSKLDKPDFFENNQGLSFMQAKRFTGEPTQSMLDRGWEKIYGEYGTAGGFIPVPVRK